MDSEDVLRCRVAVPGEVGVGVDEELRHVPISLSPEGPGHLDIHGVVDAVHEGGAGDEVMLQVVLDMTPPG